MALGFSYILCAGPGQTRDASRYGLALAHMGWQIGGGMRLVEAGVTASMRGGVMVIGDAFYDGASGSVSSLSDTVLRECKLREFNGVVLDFEQRPNRSLEEFVAEGAPFLIKRDITVTVPERYAGASAEARVLFPTAMSGGSLHSRLREATERYGRRIALEIECLRRDLLLPGPQSSGTSLHKEELDELLRARGGIKFYSQEMCTHYFTYKDNGGNTHFVLFDDAQSFRSKAQAALRQGIDSGYILYPEVEDFVHNLV